MGKEVILSFQSFLISPGPTFNNSFILQRPVEIANELRDGFYE